MKDDQPFNTETFSKAFVLDSFSVVVNVISYLSIHFQRLLTSRLNNVKNAEVDLSLRTLSRHTQEKCMEIWCGFHVFSGWKCGLTI